MGVNASNVRIGPTDPTHATDVRGGAPTRRIDSIQYLRAVAAVSVVVYHVLTNDPVDGALRHVASEGRAGVDLFFVISGFVMAWSRLAKRPIDARTFMSHRIQRVVPLYWAVTLFVLAVAVAAPSLTRTVRLTPWHVVASFLFVPALNHATGKYEPLVIPGWTLTYEMLFYLVFTAAIVAARGRPVVTILGAAAAMAALAAIGVVAAPTGVLGFYTNQIVGEFALGAVAGLVVHRARVAGSPWFVAVLLAAAVLLYLPGDWSIPPVWRRGLPATVMVISACWAALPRLRTLELVGDASYSIYIAQAPILAAIRWVVEHSWLAGVADRSVVAPLATAMLCVGAGIVVWRVVERPLTSAARRLARGRDDARPGR